MMSPITPPSITTKRTLVASTPTSSSSPSLDPYDWYEYDTPLIQTPSWPHKEEKDVTKESTETTTTPPPPNRKRSLTEEHSSSPSLVETISTCPTHSLTHHHHYDNDDDDDNDENDYSIITAPLLCSRDKMLHTLPKLVPTRGTKGVSCSASTCTTDAIYQNCEEEEDVVSSIGSNSTFSTLDEEEEVTRQSSLMTTPYYNKRGHGASFSMSLPWDAESQVRLHTLEHQEPRRLHPQLECFGDSLHYSLSSSSSQEYQKYEEESMPSTPSSSSSSSLLLGKKKKEVTYTSSSPLHRKCVLQEAELRAMTAETNAMLIREELHWIPHAQLSKVLKQDSRHFLSSPAKTIATTSSDGTTTTTTTTTKEDVLPYDCDPSPEESEEEEEVHADLRFLTLREVQDATARARWDCRKMERIVGCAQRAAGRAREYSCALEVQDGRYYSSSSFRRRQRRRRRVEGEYHSKKRVQGMPTLQIFLLLLKITTLLLLTFFTFLSLDLLLTIFYTKLKLCHEFFLHYTQTVFLSFWDVVALGMVVCVATADIAVVSSGFWRWSWRWGLVVVEECEHPYIDEIEIVKEGKS